MNRRLTCFETIIFAVKLISFSTVHSFPSAEVQLMSFIGPIYPSLLAVISQQQISRSTCAKQLHCVGRTSQDTCLAWQPDLWDHYCQWHSIHLLRYYISGQKERRLQQPEPRWAGLGKVRVLIARAQIEPSLSIPELGVSMLSNFPRQPKWANLPHCESYSE
jgi:hypothetical protein